MVDDYSPLGSVASNTSQHAISLALLAMFGCGIWTVPANEATRTIEPDLADVDVLTLDCREGLVPFYEACGFERHEMLAELPDGTEEELVAMRYAGSDSNSNAES